VQELDAEENQDLMAALLELRGHLRNLQWYGDVNRRGFVKITKKLDKKIPAAHAQKKYLQLKVDPSPFATSLQLLEEVNNINNWLSMLGDSAACNEGSSHVSTMPLRRVTSRQNLDLQPEKLALVEQQVRDDHVDGLTASLRLVEELEHGMDGTASQQFLKNLLQRAIFYKSRQCIAALLERIVFLDDQDDIHKRNCIHRLVISIGRSQTSADSEASAETSLRGLDDNDRFITPATAPTLPPTKVLQEAHQRQLLGVDDESVALLQYLLDQLKPAHRPAVVARDAAGRTPLHYGAQHGFKIVCQIIVQQLQSWKLFRVEGGIDGPEWQDNEGWAPLHLSVVGGHPLTTQTLLHAENWQGPNETMAVVCRNQPRSSAVLAMAVKANFVDIVRLLIEAGVDINYQDRQGETALHVAARYGHDLCAKFLLEGSHLQKANTELAEYTYAWTPLFIASVDGNLGVAELLIETGADIDRVDSSGWTAKEHASLRGHISIARLLAEITGVPESSPSETSTNASTSPPTSSSLTDRKSNANSGQPTAIKTMEPVKSFGHRYLTDETMILVSLGTMDTRKALSAVNLDRIPLASAHSTQLDTALSIVVSATGAKGEPEIIDLPVQDNISTEPIVFLASDATKVRLLFDLVPTYAGSKERVVGRGVALLSSIKPSVGSKRITLQGDSTVPIIAANTMEVIGAVTFNFLVITPFKHPRMSVTEQQTYWKSMASTMVIGHRGLGKNIAGRKSLQLGENTIQSFISAANLGASYVEFDVQLTKDHVPVIYHDFLVSETGIDAPVHTLTLEQFLHVNNTRTPRGSRPASPASMHAKLAEVKGVDSKRQRSMSVGGSNAHEPFDMSEKMKHTRDFKKKGFKGNSRGNHIQEPFATLQDMFRKLPKTVGFNIEMKYPMLHESEEEEMDTYAVELNSFVDTVLTTVYDMGQGRNMIFSSFNPDVCLLLSFKQPSIPVLFLTDSGTQQVGDIRASSLQEGIRFASRWNLLGVVSAAEPLVVSPRLVKVVKESGLVCVSYGAINNDPEKVQLQVKEGIDAVIVDSVLAIRKELTAVAAQKDLGVAGNGTGSAPGTKRSRSTSASSMHIPSAVSQTNGVLPPRNLPVPMGITKSS
jgi:glycerophosphodiester phosphodiesterase